MLINFVYFSDVYLFTFCASIHFFAWKFVSSLSYICHTFHVLSLIMVMQLLKRKQVNL